MQTKTINLYEYSELSPKAKEKALANHRENNFDQFELTVTLDNLLSELLEEHKITHPKDNYPKIYYSLSYSQGDGLMFEGSLTWKDYNVTIKQTGHYYHSKSASITITDDSGEEVDEQVWLQFAEIYQEICKKLEKVGYEEIDFMNSEDYFIEYCDANEITFREDGTIENA